MNCDWCSYQTKTSKNASRHLFEHYLFSHSGLLTEDKLICDQCGHQAIRSGDLISHIDRKHGDQPKPTLACDDCSKRYRSMSSLSSHIESAHLSDAHYCEQCGGRFDRKNRLIHHTRLWHGKKLYCDHCRYWCRNRRKLNGHIRAKQHWDARKMPHFWW